MINAKNGMHNLERRLPMKNRNLLQKIIGGVICIGIVAGATSCTDNTVQTSEDTSTQTTEQSLESVSDRPDTDGNPIDSYQSVHDDNTIPDDLADLGIIEKKDGTFYCQPNKCEGEAWTINEIIEEMEDKNEFFNDISKISVGQAIINLQFIDNGIKNCKRYCYMTSISAYGHKKVFEKPVGLKIMDMLQFDDIFIMAENYDGGGDKWVFTKYGITEIPDDSRIDTLNPLTNLIEYGYGITFMYRDDGKIGYVRRPYKFNAMNDIGCILKYVSRDELYREEGYAIFENNEFVYYPEKTLTISEARDIDGEFQMFKSCDWSAWPSEIQNAQTLDDLIEYNKTVYARAK